ncbi:MAG: radical SAM family heme chaperone HemW [Clostridiaceae bacterium]|nr:radical SAM family heme chaperone HemW [Clostridiaceae bacterium]
MESLGLYIHIPFCKRKCDYCDFYSICDLSDKLMDRYLSALVSQLEDYFRYGKRTVDTVYIGGGTPSVFGGKRIEKLLKEIRSSVELSRNTEITVEANPESIDEKFLKGISAAGVNRISIGVQSANDQELAALGRLHNFEKACQSVKLASKYIDNISLDLIYGLEGQSLDSWLDTLEKTIALNPSHISCYCLKVEEGTPLWQRGCVQPDEGVQADMYLEGVKILEQNNYKQYEISNFAKDGRISRHNSKYWELSEYLGLGCSAHSLYGGQRFSFVPDIQSYIGGVLGKKPVAEDMDELAYINRSGEYVMLKLRTTEGIDPDKFHQRFKVDFDPYEKLLEKYIESGHAEKSQGRYRLTPKGFLVSNVIIGDLVNTVCSQQ